MCPSVSTFTGDLHNKYNSVALAYIISPVIKGILPKLARLRFFVACASWKSLANPGLSFSSRVLMLYARLSSQRREPGAHPGVSP